MTLQEKVLKDLENLSIEEQKEVLNFIQFLQFKKNNKPVDETEYLLQSEANKNRLLQAIKNVENRQYLIEVNLDEI